MDPAKQPTDRISDLQRRRQSRSLPSAGFTHVLRPVAGLPWVMDVVVGGPVVNRDRLQPLPHDG